MRKISLKSSFNQLIYLILILCLSSTIFGFCRVDSYIKDIEGNLVGSGVGTAVCLDDTSQNITDFPTKTGYILYQFGSFSSTCNSLCDSNGVKISYTGNNTYAESTVHKVDGNWSESLSKTTHNLSLLSETTKPLIYIENPVNNKEFSVGEKIIFKIKVYDNYKFSKFNSTNKEKAYINIIDPSSKKTKLYLDVFEQIQNDKELILSTEFPNTNEKGDYTVEYFIEDMYSNKNSMTSSFKVVKKSSSSSGSYNPPKNIVDNSKDNTVETNSNNDLDKGDISKSDENNLGISENNLNSNIVKESVVEKENVNNNIEEINLENNINLNEKNTSLFNWKYIVSGILGIFILFYLFF